MKALVPRAAELLIHIDRGLVNTRGAWPELRRHPAHPGSALIPPEGLSLLSELGSDLSVHGNLTEILPHVPFDFSCIVQLRLFLSIAHMHEASFCFTSGKGILDGRSHAPPPHMLAFPATNDMTGRDSTAIDPRSSHRHMSSVPFHQHEMPVWKF